MKTTKYWNYIWDVLGWGSSCAILFLTKLQLDPLPSNFTNSSIKHHASRLCSSCNRIVATIYEEYPVVLACVNSGPPAGKFKLKVRPSCCNSHHVDSNGRQPRSRLHTHYLKAKWSESLIVSQTVFTFRTQSKNFKKILSLGWLGNKVSPFAPCWIDPTPNRLWRFRPARHCR